MTTSTALCNRIKGLCKEHNISYRELAQKSGVPESRIRRMYYGAVGNPGVFMMMKICNVFGISLDEFFDTEEFKEALKEKTE